MPNSDNRRDDANGELPKIRIPLTKNQKDILKEFYDIPSTSVVFTKNERKEIWDQFKLKRLIPDIELKSRCPALLAELQKSINNVNLIQSAVFSECSYAQTLANMLELPKFYNYSVSPECLSNSLVLLLNSYKMVARYVYKSNDDRRILIQAGGHGGIDSALITVQDKTIFSIEFKEQAAKTSEPDLPPYGEDGYLTITAEFLLKNPQFEFMINEQILKSLNFWNVMGTNVNNFSKEGIQIAVSDNYASKKFADVICVEDEQGRLTMIPANQVGLWSKTSGEIRPAGRNMHAVWTPNALTDFIVLSGGQIYKGIVTIGIDKLVPAKARGGDNSITRYKINPIFFVREQNVELDQGTARFQFDKVLQLRPTISAHMHFNKLSVHKVHDYYRPEF